jgi:DNA modification methylase
MFHKTPGTTPRKPVELARRAIEYSSLPGEAVLDPFAGSGSTSLQVVSADAIAET